MIEDAKDKICEKCNTRKTYTSSKEYLRSKNYPISMSFCVPCENEIYKTIHTFFEKHLRLKKRKCELCFKKFKTYFNKQIYCKKCSIKKVDEETNGYHTITIFDCHPICGLFETYYAGYYNGKYKNICTKFGISCNYIIYKTCNFKEVILGKFKEVMNDS